MIRISVMISHLLESLFKLLLPVICVSFFITNGVKGPMRFLFSSGDATSSKFGVRPDVFSARSGCDIHGGHADTHQHRVH